MKARIRADKVKVLEQEGMALVIEFADVLGNSVVVEVPDASGISLVEQITVFPAPEEKKEGRKARPAAEGGAL